MLLGNCLQNSTHIHTHTQEADSRHPVPGNVGHLGRWSPLCGRVPNEPVWTEQTEDRRVPGGDKFRVQHGCPGVSGGAHGDGQQADRRGTQTVPADIQNARESTRTLYVQSLLQSVLYVIGSLANCTYMYMYMYVYICMSQLNGKWLQRL